MNLSENQELVQKLNLILQDFPGLEYDQLTSARIKKMLMVKVSTDANCDISTAGVIAQKLSESTGEQFKVQALAGAERFTFENIRGFGLFQFLPNKNVRITYPAHKGDKLEIDIMEGMEMELNMNDEDIWYFAEGNELTIQFNIFAQPNYHKYLRSHVTKVNRDDKATKDGDLLSESSSM